MKILVTFKTPDAKFYAMCDEKARLSNCFDPPLSEEAREAELDKLDEVLDKFLGFGELITIEFDTETRTAVVTEKGK